MRKIIAFIPARGGSKGVKNKNLAMVAERPLLHYTLDEANKSKYISLSILSSDSKEILEFGKNYHPIMPLERPQHLSTDTSTIEDAMKYHFTTDISYSPEDLILLLHPTVPLRTHKHIDEAIELFLANQVDSVISVSEPMEHPFDMVYWEEGNQIEFLSKAIVPGLTQRQNFKKYFFLNGAIYIFSFSLLFEKNTRFGKSSLPYHMNQLDSIDIDTQADLKIADLLLRERLKT